MALRARNRICVGGAKRGEILSLVWEKSTENMVTNRWNEILYKHHYPGNLSFKMMWVTG
jgi:hypothetical protein